MVDRLLCARLVHKHGHLSVIVAYAPTQSSADADKDTFYQQLDSLISASPHDTTIILGDFNAVTGSDRHGFESVIGNYMAQVVRTTTQLGCCPCVLLTAYPFLDPGLNEKIFTDTAGSAMMDTPGKN